jgi:hypothetical protein
MSRHELIFEIKNLKKKHGITNDQLLLAYALLYKVEWEIDQKDLLVLYNKGIVKGGNKVSTTALFGKEEASQVSLDLTFETDPIGTEETLTIAEALKKKFAPDKDFEEHFLKEIAQSYFGGDTKIAYYYMIYKALFPKSSSSTDNSKWNAVFGFRYDGKTKWTSSTVAAKKFAKIYKTVDIGLFLSGVFYYMKDSIDYERATCYAVRSDRYLQLHDSWTHIAKEKLEEAKQKEKKDV